MRKPMREYLQSLLIGWRTGAGLTLDEVARKLVMPESVLMGFELYPEMMSILQMGQYAKACGVHEPHMVLLTSYLPPAADAPAMIDIFDEE
jgi:hypothetical protein